MGNPGPLPRDPYLDYLRGFAIIWVVLIHATSTMHLYFPSALTFEMPLFFFVSGASLYLAGSRATPVGPFLRHRLRRLLVPYALLAVVCSALFYATEFLAGRPLSTSYLVGWLLLAHQSPYPPGVDAYMWFVRVAVAVTLAHLALIRVFASVRHRHLVAVLLVATVFSLSFATRPVPDLVIVPVALLPQYTVFYASFLYLGYYYGSGHLWLRPWQLGFAAVGGLLSLALLGSAVLGSPVVDANPPRAGLWLLGFSWIAIWLLLRPLAMALADRVHALGWTLRFFGTHTYSVYLFHGLGLLVAFRLLAAVERLTLVQPPRALEVVVFFLLSLALSALIAVIVDRALGPRTSASRRIAALRAGQSVAEGQPR